MIDLVMALRQQHAAGRTITDEGLWNATGIIMAILIGASILRKVPDGFFVAWFLSSCSSSTRPSSQPAKVVACQ
jgi:hypothetical protein